MVAAEIRFGLATERLARRLPPDDDRRRCRAHAARPDPNASLPMPRSTAGRAEVEADPDDWRRWYRLALAYDDAGDRRRARAAMRTAIERAG